METDRTARYRARGADNVEDVVGEHTDPNVLEVVEDKRKHEKQPEDREIVEGVPMRAERGVDIGNEHAKRDGDRWDRSPSEAGITHRRGSATPPVHTQRGLPRRRTQGR